MESVDGWQMVPRRGRTTEGSDDPKPGTAPIPEEDDPWKPGSPSKSFLDAMKRPDRLHTKRKTKRNTGMGDDAVDTPTVGMPLSSSITTTSVSETSIQKMPKNLGTQVTAEGCPFGVEKEKEGEEDGEKDFDIPAPVGGLSLGLEKKEEEEEGEDGEKDFDIPAPVGGLSLGVEKEEEEDDGESKGSEVIPVDDKTSLLSPETAAPLSMPYPEMEPLKEHLMKKGMNSEEALEQLAVWDDHVRNPKNRVRLPTREVSDGVVCTKGILDRDSTPFFVEANESGQASSLDSYMVAVPRNTRLAETLPFESVVFECVRSHTNKILQSFNEMVFDRKLVPPVLAFCQHVLPDGDVERFDPRAGFDKDAVDREFARVELTTEQDHCVTSVKSQIDAYETGLHDFGIYPRYKKDGVVQEVLRLPEDGGIMFDILKQFLSTLSTAKERQMVVALVMITCLLRIHVTWSEPDDLKLALRRLRIESPEYLTRFLRVACFQFVLQFREPLVEKLLGNVFLDPIIAPLEGGRETTRKEDIEGLLEAQTARNHDIQLRLIVKDEFTRSFENLNVEIDGEIHKHVGFACTNPSLDPTVFVPVSEPPSVVSFLCFLTAEFYLGSRTPIHPHVPQKFWGVPKETGEKETIMVTPEDLCGIHMQEVPRCMSLVHLSQSQESPQVLVRALLVCTAKTNLARETETKTETEAGALDETV